jgi:hypothetical protein
MDSGRVFRFLVMFLTLLGVMWAIRGICGRHHGASPIEAQPSAVKAAYVPEPDPARYELPLVAFENSCQDGQNIDISSCTGKLSRSEGRTYRLTLTHDSPVVIEVRPLDNLFDPAFALRDASGRCVIGADDQGEAEAERAELKRLPAGEYQLIVAGYGDQCGPYQLTVREPLPMFGSTDAPRVVRGPNGVSLQWDTFGECEVGQFKVYRQIDGERTLVATVRSHGSPARPARYRWVDRSPLPDTRYELEAVAVDGRTEPLGSVAS